MRYFITNQKHNVIANSNMQIKPISYIPTMIKKLRKQSIIPFDTETTGLDAYKHKIILLCFSCDKHDYVIDRESLKDISFIFRELEGKEFLGHNIKFDIKMVFTDCGYLITNVWDTMIADQRLYMGLKYKNALDDLMLRYYGKLPDGMIDGVPNEWIGKTNFKFNNRHIDYSAADTCQLIGIYKRQLTAMIKYKMEFLLQNIEMPLISEIALCELEGAYLDTKKLKELVTFNFKEKFRLECELDQELRELREDGLLIALTDNEKMYLKHGKYDRVRSPCNSIVQLDIFGNEEIIEYETPLGNINWNSQPQLVTILGRLKQPVPTNVYKYIVPTFTKDGKLVKTGFKFTTGEKEINEYLIDEPHSPVKKLLELLIEYRGIMKELSTYGLNLIDCINPVSGKIHTTYRQCAAVNGRFQSGGGKNEPDKINSQNIPRKKELRELFSAGKDYNVLTCDLTGAEVTIMAAKANDTKLFELAMKGDIHSHMATLGWRAIYRSRGDKMNAVNWLVTKKINSEFRQTAKNLTFATVYNVGDRKAGKTIGVSKEEGKIYKDTLKSEIPLTIAMVEKNVARALKFGYLILNERTNSRKWFPEVLEAFKEGEKNDRGYVILEYSKQEAVEGEARNIPISGTQADMIKEMIVEIGRLKRANNWDIGLIFQVHDELDYRIPKGEEGEEIAKQIKNKMCEVANRYLGDLIQMDASATIAETWTKD
jgi:DNA polymerase I-like protein with 3'-5' exonuclease and polymerase domains